MLLLLKSFYGNKTKFMTPAKTSFFPLGWKIHELEVSSGSCYNFSDITFDTIGHRRRCGGFYQPTYLVLYGAASRRTAYRFVKAQRQRKSSLIESFTKVADLPVKKNVLDRQLESCKAIVFTLLEL